MVLKLHRSKQTYLLVSVLLASFFVVVIAVPYKTLRNQFPLSQINVRTVKAQNTQGGGKTSAKTGLFKYLPDGAKIQDQSKDVVVADLNDDGQQEVVTFYSLPDSFVGVSVLKPVGTDYIRLWEKVYDDASRFDMPPSGVYDLNRSGRPQIVIYRGIGTSCPGVLEIYESRKGKIEPITGSWADDGQCQAVKIKDLNGDGIPEVITSNPHTAISDIYRWNGKRYIQSDSQFPQFYSNALTQLIKDIHSLESLPTSARLEWCEEAVKIYRFEHRYTEAMQLCEEVLSIIDDLNLTKPVINTKEEGAPDQQGRIMAYFEIEKSAGKAGIHHLMGDIYMAAGNLKQAQNEYTESERLKDQVKDMRSKLPI